MPVLFQLIQEGNDSITQMKSIESLVSLSAKVDFECRVSVAFMFLFSILNLQNRAIKQQKTSAAFTNLLVCTNVGLRKRKC